MQESESESLLKTAWSLLFPYKIIVEKQTGVNSTPGSAVRQSNQQHSLELWLKSIGPDYIMKTFCNGKGKMHNSHIVEHLVLSRHKVVAINETKKLKCFSCDNTNIFELGFVQAEDTVVILCRLPCSVKSDILDKKLEKSANAKPHYIRYNEGAQRLFYV